MCDKKYLFWVRSTLTSNNTVHVHLYSNEIIRIEVLVELNLYTTSIIRLFWPPTVTQGKIQIIKCTLAGVTLTNMTINCWYCCRNVILLPPHPSKLIYYYDPHKLLFIIIYYLWKPLHYSHSESFSSACLCYASY